LNLLILSKKVLAMIKLIRPRLQNLRLGTIHIQRQRQQYRRPPLSMSCFEMMMSMWTLRKSQSWSRSLCRSQQMSRKQQAHLLRKPIMG
jgi:hypothetical protein